MVGINVPIPVPVAWHSFGGLEGVALRRRADVRPRGDPLLHPAEGRHLALAGPGVERDRPRLPDQRMTGVRRVAISERRRGASGAAFRATTAAPAEPVESEKPNGPRSRKGAQTRARLLEAAKEIFEDNGFLDARISDIAERAGLSHGSFYHYFDSKEEIFREVAAAVDQELSAPLADVIRAPASGATPHERIRQAIRLHFESYRDEARIMGVIEEVSRYDEQVNALRFARHQDYRDQVADSIRQLQRHGLADPSLDPNIAASALGAMTSRFAEMWLVQGFLECSFDDGVEQLTKVFTNTLQLKDPRARGEDLAVANVPVTFSARAVLAQ